MSLLLGSYAGLILFFYNCFLDFGFVGGVSTVKLSTNCSLNEPM